MREVTKQTDNEFLNIKTVVHPEYHISGYQFAERLGGSDWKAIVILSKS